MVSKMNTGGKNLKKSRVEFLARNEDSTWTKFIKKAEWPNLLNKYDWFVVCRTQKHRLGRNFLQIWDIFHKTGVEKLLELAQTTGLYYLGKKFHATIYPVCNLSEARIIQDTLEKESRRQLRPKYKYESLCEMAS